MALGYKPVNREQLFLLPPDMREWLPEGHLAFFVLDVVARLDTSALHAAHPTGGPGRQAYHPDMMLALLVYAYATGERSSRQVERRCETDVAYRVVAAGQRPDHSTFARFRADHAQAVAALFVDVLALCHEAGLVRLGAVAVDGTKMKADAASAANRTRDQIEEAVARLLAEADATDAAEDAAHGPGRGDELPPELADRSRRAARLDAALAGLAAKEADRRAAETAREQAARHLAATGRRRSGRQFKGSVTLDATEHELAAAEAELAGKRAAWRVARAAARAAGEAVPAHPSAARVTMLRRRLERLRTEPPAPPPPPKAPRANTTDPDSVLLKAPSGWVQGYNAQAAVSEGGIVLAAAVTRSHSDSEQFLPMLRLTEDSLAAAGIAEAVGTMLFDAGYCSQENLAAPGPDRLVATAKSFKLRRRVAEEGYADGEPPVGASPLARMEHRLRTKAGAALYARRSVIVEPVFGDLKQNRGYRAFVRRGIVACDAEWQLICMTHNLNKLFRAFKGSLTTA